MFGILFVCAAASFTLSAMIVATKAWHGGRTLDNEMNGAQKFHKIAVPRVGGLAIVFGILLVLALARFDYLEIRYGADLESVFSLVVASLPVFAAGLAEDMTKRVSVKARLLAAFASALLACWLLEVYLPRLGISGLDDMLILITPVCILITVVAVTGVTNSINIVDGFHGLAGSTVVIVLAGMGFLAMEHGDDLVLEIAAIGISATLGFLWVNYPTGRLFVGDGGAYFMGFWVAEVAVLLIFRNPTISTWQVLAVCAYPVIEVLYSIYRKKIVRKTNATVPDRLHLHMLVYRRLVCRIIPYDGQRPWIRNAAVAFVIAPGVVLTTVTALVAGSTAPGAIAVVLLEVLIYMAVYTRLVRGHWRLNPKMMFWLRTATGNKHV
jgi:UDP-N-acetylmuramyl pentapeptide phosphotransferase/UDP-N-acetylglucosamine-1-phosphate transferase